MLDKYIYEGLHFIMKWSGQINSWAWRKHAKILRAKQSQEMEELIRNQDDEFNMRLTQNKGTIWMDPDIKSSYHPRASLLKFFIQYLQYGFFKVRVMQKRRGFASFFLYYSFPFYFNLTFFIFIVFAIYDSYSNSNGIGFIYALFIFRYFKCFHEESTKYPINYNSTIISPLNAFCLWYRFLFWNNLLFK